MATREPAAQPGQQTSAQSAALACTTKLRVNRPRARRERRARWSASPARPADCGEPAPLGRRRRAGPAEPGPDHPALLPGPRRRLHVPVGEREPPPEHGQQLATPRRPPRRTWRTAVRPWPWPGPRRTRRPAPGTDRRCRPPRRTRDPRPARRAPGARVAPRRPPPAPSRGRRPQHGAAPGESAARRRRAWPTARRPPRRPRTPGGTGPRTPTRPARPSRAPRAAGPAPCTPAAAEPPDGRCRAAPRTGWRGLEPRQRRSALINCAGRVGVDRAAAEAPRRSGWSGRPAGPGAGQ